jgi:MoxR-like ATPase
VDVELGAIRQPFAELVHRIRHAGIPVSDRRAVKLQRVVAASALLSGRSEARISDIWVVRHIWDTEEQQEVLASLVDHAIAREQPAAGDHPRARSGDGPDAESLARDLDAMEKAASEDSLPDVERAYLRDRLGILEGRCQWVKDETRRAWLEKRVKDLWPRMKT